MLFNVPLFVSSFTFTFLVQYCYYETINKVMIIQPGIKFSFLFENSYP